MNTPEEIVKMQTKGLITIPKTFRDELGFSTNGLVRVVKDKGRIILEPVRTLPYPVRYYTKAEVESFIREDKKDSAKLKKKKLL